MTRTEFSTAYAAELREAAEFDAMIAEENKKRIGNPICEEADRIWIELNTATPESEAAKMASPEFMRVFGSHDYLNVETCAEISIDTV